MEWSLEHRLALLDNVVSMRQFVEAPARWLQRELVATAAAKERLKTWARAGGLARASRDTSELRCCGDLDIHVAAVMALRMLAPPARDYVMDHAFVVCVGETTEGFALKLPADMPAGKGARLVALTVGAPEGNPSRTAWAVRVALHEFAHVWLEPDETFSAPTADEQQQIAAARNAGRHYSAKQSAIELRAWSLAERWEGQPFSGDFWLQVRRSLTDVKGPITSVCD
jgi:hypothetical protein